MKSSKVYESRFDWVSWDKDVMELLDDDNMKKKKKNLLVLIVKMS